MEPGACSSRALTSERKLIFWGLPSAWVPKEASEFSWMVPDQSGMTDKRSFLSSSLFSPSLNRSRTIRIKAHSIKVFVTIVKSQQGGAVDIQYDQKFQRPWIKNVAVPRAPVQSFPLRDLATSVILQMCRQLTEANRPAGSSPPFIKKSGFHWQLPNALCNKTKKKFTHKVPILYFIGTGLNSFGKTYHHCYEGERGEDVRRDQIQALLYSLSLTWKLWKVLLMLFSHSLDWV